MDCGCGCGCAYLNRTAPRSNVCTYIHVLMYFHTKMSSSVGRIKIYELLSYYLVIYHHIIDTEYITPYKFGQSHIYKA